MIVLRVFIYCTERYRYSIVMHKASAQEVEFGCVLRVGLLCLSDF